MRSHWPNNFFFPSFFEYKSQSFGSRDRPQSSAALFTLISSSLSTGCLQIGHRFVWNCKTFAHSLHMHCIDRTKDVRSSTYPDSQPNTHPNMGPKPCKLVFYCSSTIHPSSMEYIYIQKYFFKQIFKWELKTTHDASLSGWSGQTTKQKTSKILLVLLLNLSSAFKGSWLKHLQPTASNHGLKNRATTYNMQLSSHFSVQRTTFNTGYGEVQWR